MRITNNGFLLCALSLSLCYYNCVYLFILFERKKEIKIKMSFNYNHDNNNYIFFLFTL